jgi:hypothetical protein
MQTLALTDEEIVVHDLARERVAERVLVAFRRIAHELALHELTDVRLERRLVKTSHGPQRVEREAVTEDRGCRERRPSVRGEVLDPGAHRLADRAGDRELVDRFALPAALLVEIHPA